MKSKFEHFLDTKEGKFILRGKLRKDERFSLCLIRRELSDRWSKDFNPLQIHSICSKVGNVKKMLVIWEILYNYTDLDKNYHLDCIFNPNESTKDGNQRIYLVIEEKTKYQVSKIPLPLDQMPFTFEEYQENCKFLYNRIFQLECIKLAQEKEINELKQQMNKERSSMSQTERNMKSNIKKLKTKIQAKEQKELIDRLSQPKFVNRANDTSASLIDFSLPQASRILTMQSFKGKTKLNKSSKSQKTSKSKRSASKKSSVPAMDKIAKSAYSTNNDYNYEKDYTRLTEQRPSSAFSPSQSYHSYSSSKNDIISLNPQQSERDNIFNQTYSSRNPSYVTRNSQYMDVDYNMQRSSSLSHHDTENIEEEEPEGEEDFECVPDQEASQNEYATDQSYHSQHSSKTYNSSKYGKEYNSQKSISLSPYSSEHEYNTRSAYSSAQGDNYTKSYYSASNGGTYERGSSLRDDEYSKEYSQKGYSKSSSKRASRSSSSKYKNKTTFSSPTEIFITDDEEDYFD